MIVWGGYAGRSVTIGGRYDPATDTWSADVVAGECTRRRRYRHTAVWTGTEMIVWGGWDATGLNTGGRYDPTTDTWSSTSTAAGVPSAASRAHGGVDRDGDDRLGRLGRHRRPDQHRRTLRSRDRSLDADVDGDGRAIAADRPHCRVDRDGDDRLGRI